MKIGPYPLPSPVLLAPMAGVTDLPFRKLCRRLGAGLVVSEMIISDSRLWDTRKSRQRLSHEGEPDPRSVQIAGSDPDMMAQAARLTVANGAQIVDINMGCPAKKVCKKLAGSALLKDETLVESILTAVVKAVDVPVTLKMRTGWNPENRNGVTIARIAEEAGIQSLAVHGRTRACAYKGEVEYDTIAAIKENVTIPVVANGDIDSPEKAKEVLDHTGADGIMIGRSAQGNPWIFREIAHYLASGEKLPPPRLEEVKQVMIGHLSSLHDFYGEYLGIRIARKHFGWYVQKLPGGADFRKSFNLLDTASKQTASAQDFFEHLIEGEVMAA
ncbi:MAG: tRNA dihydrouridine synthase DusB [Pseudomonadales bacterium]|nr:tRNA dihydrouridine synthase DusB [Pseudomonadales bacterium]